MEDKAIHTLSIKVEIDKVQGTWVRGVNVCVPGVEEKKAVVFGQWCVRESGLKRDNEVPPRRKSSFLQDHIASPWW